MDVRIRMSMWSPWYHIVILYPPVYYRLVFKIMNKIQMRISLSILSVFFNWLSILIPIGMKILWKYYYCRMKTRMKRFNYMYCFLFIFRQIRPLWDPCIDSQTLFMIYGNTTTTSTLTQQNLVPPSHFPSKIIKVINKSNSIHLESGHDLFLFLILLNFFFL